MITNDVNLLSSLITNSATVRTQLATAQAQASTGKVADSYSGLGSSARTSLDLRPAISHYTALQSNISAAQGRLDVTQTALSSISSIASQFFATANSLDRTDPTAVATTAQQAKTALQQVADLLNSKSGNVYVFAGTDSSNPPLTTTDPTTLSTDLLASDTGAPFSSTLTSTVPSIEVGDGDFVKVGVLANANSAAVSAAPTTGSALRDTLKALASLAGLTPGASNVDTTVTGARDTLNSAVSALATETGVLGETQSGLTQRATTLTALSGAVTKQLSSVEDVDFAAAVVKASALQTQLQASYQILAQARSLSLTNFL